MRAFATMLLFRALANEDIMKLSFLALIAALLLGGCNTFEGAGKDIERGGEKLQDTAKDVKQKM